ncbi:MAG: DUF1643 domain-containing protein [Gammaproteobacteria bacterium]
MQRSAIISPCKKYRYELTRVWDASKPWVLFICLNPSTADHEAEDNTSRVCINYGRRWDYGGLVIANLFAYRATDKSMLYRVDDPIGPDNDEHLEKLSTVAVETVCAWSDDGRYKDRDIQILAMLDNPKCLTRLKSGRPGHPLYKSRELKPVPLYYEKLF